MSGDVMEYPPNWEDFAEQYSITDSEEVYTNGSKLISLFRVHQMVKHYFAEPPCGGNYCPNCGAKVVE